MMEALPAMITRWQSETRLVSSLRRVIVPMPQPGPGEVLLRVEAVSLNFRDLANLEGTMGHWSAPHLPGADMRAEVVAQGPGAERFSLGDKVTNVDIACWTDGPAPEAGTNVVPFLGRLAEYVVAEEDLLVPAPSTLDAAETSTLPVAALTAWFAVVELGRVRAGDVVVVQGTGGVSLFALQFAAASGARVIVTSRSADKLARVAALGAAEMIDVTVEPDWAARVLALTQGRGADHVLEMGGGDITPALHALTFGGRISIIGLLADTDLRAPIGQILYKRAVIQGLGVGHKRAFSDMSRAIDRMRIKPVIDRIYPFAQAPEAFEHLRRGAFGKVVISVAS